MKHVEIPGFPHFVSYSKDDGDNTKMDELFKEYNITNQSFIDKVHTIAVIFNEDTGPKKIWKRAIEFIAKKDSLTKKDEENIQSHPLFLEKLQHYDAQPNDYYLLKPIDSLFDEIEKSVKESQKKN